MEFKPLDQEKKELRLLRIVLPNEDDTPSQVCDDVHDPPISLTLEHRCRDEVEYTALSYVWGDRTDPAYIFVNEVETPIFRNLYEALKQLRQKRIVSWMWIDAICINQEDDEEKSWQVNEMGNIFEEAKMVYYWLGPSADDSDFLLDQFADLGQRAFSAGVDDLYFFEEDSDWQDSVLGFLRHRYPDATPSPALSVYTTPLPPKPLEVDGPSEPTLGAFEFLEDFITQPPTSLYRTGKALERLLLREFWYRVWIIQELTLPRTAVICCGDRLQAIQYFHSAVSVFGHISRLALVQENSGVGQKLDYYPVNHNLFRIHGLKSRYNLHRHRKRQPLRSFLMQLPGEPSRPVYTSSDPRDVVFGLLGIVDDAEVLGLVADYRMTVAEVFATVTKQGIRRDGVEVLSFNIFPKTLSDLPSWVPDWSQLGRRGWPFHPRGIRSTFTTASFDASRSRLQPDRSDSPKDRFFVIELTGVEHSHIASKLETPPRPPRLRRGHLRKPAYLDELCSFWVQHGVDQAEIMIQGVLEDYNFCTTKSGLLDHDNRTFMSLARRALEYGPSPGLTTQAFSVEEEDYLLRYCRYLGLRDEDPSVQEAFTTFYWEMESHAAGKMRHQTLFITDTGAIGKSARYIAVGDKVTVLYGYKAPVVLRHREAGRFEYVADAYVDGIMYGEALDQGAPETVFEIV